MMFHYSLEGYVPVCMWVLFLWKGISSPLDLDTGCPFSLQASLSDIALFLEWTVSFEGDDQPRSLFCKKVFIYRKVQWF